MRGVRAVASGFAGLLVLAGIEVGAARAVAPADSVSAGPRLLASTEETAPKKAGPADHPQTGERVVQLPEEVVHGTGITFGENGAMTLRMAGRDAQRLPGGFADPTRVLTALPGVSNDSDFDGLLFVQGGDGGQNRILIDQVSVSDAYHFGGVVSVLNTDVIDRLEFLSGGYTAEYGDALSGVLKIKRRIGDLSRVRAGVGLSLLTANGTLEGPLGEDGRGSWLLAARRSYIDQVLKGRTSGPAALPAYWDVDARVYRRVGANDLRLGFLRSGDFLSARLGDTFAFAPAESSGLEWNRHLTMASLNWERAAGRWALTQAVAYAWRAQAVELFGGLPQHADQDVRTFDWRGDARRPSRRITWVTGAQLTHSHTEYGLDINRLSILEPDRRSNPRSPLDTARVTAAYEGRNVYLAGYAQVEASGLDSTLGVIAGVRIERASRSGQTEPTPRLRLTWRTPLPGITLHAAAGEYLQFPGDRLEADPTIGNADLRAERARHLLAGVTRTFRRGERLSLEGYHKRLGDLIVYDANAPAGAPPYANTGTGTARGIEFLAHVPRPRWDAWVSYSWGEVRYRNFPGSAEYAPAQDLRHTIAVVGRVRPSPGWTLGVKWRAQSGRPYTPVVGRENVSEFYDGLGWIPVLGEYHSGRFPWYHRLDVRGEREFRIGATRATAALELINAYGRRNLYDYRYVDGYSRATPVRMLPFLPSFGVTVAF
ncbi:MAG: TonB-dependent receptor plug domain-containing protein [Candidatus Eisenbacteria bacterium]